MPLKKNIAISQISKNKTQPLNEYSNMKDKISLIIPTYNSQKTILQCIDSILSQSHKNFEIIVVDDGSSDNTIDIVNQIKTNKIKIISQTNMGVSAARNTGLKKASGDYILFVDSDDILEDNCLTRLLSCAQKTRCDIIKFNHFTCSGIYKTKNSFYDLSNKYITEKNINRAYEHLVYGEEPIKCLVMTLFLKKEFLESNNTVFNTDLYMMEDVAFYVDIMKLKPKIYFYDYSLYDYRLNDNSVTHKKGNGFKIIKGIIDTGNYIKDKVPCKNKLFANLIKLIVYYAAVDNLPLMQCREVVLNSNVQEYAKNSSFKSKKYLWLLPILAIHTKSPFLFFISSKIYKLRIKIKERSIRRVYL